MNVIQGIRTRVLIAADDSEQSLEAARAARSLFGDDAEYTVVSVGVDDTALWVGMPVVWGVPYALAVPPVGPSGPPLELAHTDGEVAPTPADLAEQQADEVAAAAQLPGATVVGEVGDAAEAILRAAERCGADVIVVGSHDRGWFSRLLTTSVSDVVVRSAPVPVLVVGGPAAA